METSEECTELRDLFDKLVAEAEISLERINQLKFKFNKEVGKVEAALSPSIRDQLKEHTKEGLQQLIDCLTNLNIDLELDDNSDNRFSIPPMPIDNGPVDLKFLSGDSPWSFWLIDQQVDVKLVQKHLLKKFQNDLLDSYCKNPEHMDSVCFFDRNKIYRGIILQKMNENRVKLLDCDSNISKVITMDKIFNIDPDACNVHASAIKCTISKDSNVDAVLWLKGGMNLRDIFCDALKEAVLKVKIIERITDSIDKIPFYLVNVDMQMEDEGLQGNLKDWIYGRIIPELKKINSIDNEPLCYLLSDEALNPFCTTSPGIIRETDQAYKKCDVKEASSSSGFVKKETNNLNCISNKVSQKVVEVLSQKVVSQEVFPNIESAVSETSTTSESNELLETSQENLVSSSSVSVTDSEDNDTDKIDSKVTENRLDQSSKEFKLNETTQPRVTLGSNNTRGSPMNNQHSSAPHPGSKYSFQSVPSGYQHPPQIPYHPWASGYHLTPVPHVTWSTPFPAPGFGHQHWGPPQPQPPMIIQSSKTKASRQPHSPFQPPGFQHWGPPQAQPQLPMTIESPKTSASQQPPSDKSHTGFKNVDSSSDQSTKVANINNISVNVNVMAKEFVPKQNTSEDCPVSAGHLNAPLTSLSNTPPLKPPLEKKEIVQAQLRESTSLINPKDNLLVFISHVESPSEFYVHFVNSNNKHLDKLRELMFDYYNSRGSVQFESWREAKRILGKYCACKWDEDNNWYRVEVLDWTLGNNKVRVKSVDYGNTMEVPWPGLQPLDQKFTKLAISAKRCHLAGVVPDKEEKWSAETIDIFKRILTKVDLVTKDDLVFSVFVLPSNDQINSLKVRLYQGKYTEDSISINKLLVERGWAWSTSRSTTLSSSRQSLSDVASNLSEEDKPQKNSYKRLSLSDFDQLDKTEQSSLINQSVMSDSGVVVHASLSDKASPLTQLELPFLPSSTLISSPVSTPRVEEQQFDEDWNPQEDDYFSIRNNPALNTDDPGVALTGYAPKDEQRICRFYAERGSCWKLEEGRTCYKDHVMPRRDGITTDKEEVFHEAIEKLDLPSVGENIRVRVTSVVHMGLFYVQISNNKNGCNDVDFEEEETLGTLEPFMNLPEKVREMRKLAVPPAIGQMVLAQCDNRWYRARVVCAADKEVEHEVLFVDFGTFATIHERDLRQMEARYLHLPFQAVACSLANIVVPPSDSKEFDMGSELLTNAIDQQNMSAKVYDSGDITSKARHLQVLLQFANEIDVGEWLVDNKVCEHQPCSLSWDQ